MNKVMCVLCIGEGEGEGGGSLLVSGAVFGISGSGAGPSD